MIVIPDVALLQMEKGLENFSLGVYINFDLHIPSVRCLSLESNRK